MKEELTENEHSNRVFAIMRRFFYIILDYVQDIVCHHRPVLWHFSSQGMQLPLPPVKDFIHPPNHSSNNSGTISDKHGYEESKHDTLSFHPIFLLMSIIPFSAIAFYTGVVIRILMLSKFYNSHNGSTQALNLNISNGKMDWSVKKLPPPTVIPGEKVPSTILHTHRSISQWLQKLHALVILCKLIEDWLTSK